MDNYSLHLPFRILTGEVRKRRVRNDRTAEGMCSADLQNSRTPTKLESKGEFYGREPENVYFSKSLPAICWFPGVFGEAWLIGTFCLFVQC